MTKKFVSYKEYIMLKESLIGAPLTLGMSRNPTIGEMGMDMGMGASGGPDMGMGASGGPDMGMGMPSMKKKKRPPMPMDDEGDDDMDIEDDEEITDDEGDEDIEDDEEITDDEGDEDEISDDDEDMDMGMNFKKKKKPMMGMKPPMMTPPMGENCGHEEPDGDEDEDEDEEEEQDVEMSFQKKKQKKQKKQKKCSKCSKMNKESNEFLNSIKRMTGGNKFAIDEFGNWAAIKEDSLIPPVDINQNVTEPKAGEVGYAPQTRVGGLPSFTEWTKRK